MTKNNQDKKPVIISKDDIIPPCTLCTNTNDHRHGDMCYQGYRPGYKPKKLMNTKEPCDHIYSVATCSCCGLSFYGKDGKAVEDIPDTLECGSRELLCPHCPLCGEKLEQKHDNQ